MSLGKEKRKVLGITGIRSEYDIMSSVFSAINQHPDLDLELIVTGAHLSHEFGYTIQEIIDDGFIIADRIESLLSSNQMGSRVKGLAIQLQSMVQTIDRIRPSFLIILGDREEAMTTALIGAYMNIPVLHIAGGDRVVGNVDDQVRHAVTKLAHIHCTTNKESAERIIRLGEQSFRVHNTGNPGLDRLLTVSRIDLTEIGVRLGFPLKDDQPLLLLIQHVISSEVDQAYYQMRTTLEAVADLGISTIMTYPNSDVGSYNIIKAIDYFRDLPNLFVAKNLPRDIFINIMRQASCMIGNSSAGIMEAPLLGLPVVNIGNRQKGRLDAGNVQFVKHNKEEIVNAVSYALYNQGYRDKVKQCENPYGDGHSSERIANLLASIEIDDNLLIKDITY